MLKKHVNRTLERDIKTTPGRLVDPGILEAHRKVTIAELLEETPEPDLV